MYRQIILLMLLFLFTFTPFLPADTFVGGHISENTTWTLAESPYIITSDIEVYHPLGGNAILTIEPGVEMRFDQGTGLYIATTNGLNRGALVAAGTDSLPIVFTSNAATPAPGDWKGIYFRELTSEANTALEYCTVEYGGDTNNANVYIADVTFPLNHCTLSNSSGYGIYCTGSALSLSNNTLSDNNIGFYFSDSSPAIDKNTITNSGSYAGEIANLTFPVYTSNTFSNNNPDAIRFSGNIITSTVTQPTLANPGVPYAVATDIAVYHPLGGNVILTIEPGVELRFDPGTGLYIGSSDGYNRGALTAVGTDSLPILFTSNEDNPSPWDWKGIYFRNTTAENSTVLDFCTVEYGGELNNANVYITDTSFPISNSVISNSGGYGIYCMNYSSSITNCNISDNNTGFYFSGSSPMFDSNTVSGNGSYAGELTGLSFPVFTNNTFSNNTIEAIKWSGNIITDTITGPTLTDPGIPYSVTSDVEVYHPSGDNVILTIEPGVEMRFDPGTGLYIGSTWSLNRGALTAVGTDSLPIVFTSNATTPAPGDWKGIYFRDLTAEGSTTLEHCTVEYGGHTYNANIYIDEASFPISNSVISNGSGYGLYCTGFSSSLSNNTISDNNIGFYLSGSSPNIDSNSISNSGSYAGELTDLSLPVFTDNTFSDNAIEAIKWSGDIVTAENTYPTLTDPGIPYAVTSDVEVYHPSGDNVVLTVEPGVEMRFDPGTGLYIGSTFGLNRGALNAVGTDSLPIVFTSNAATPAPGDWTGIYFRDLTVGSSTVLDFCTVEYGGRINNANVYAFSASPTITNSTISHSSGMGIYSYGNPSPVIFNNEIHDNDIGVYSTDSSPSINYNSIISNTTYGVFNSSSSVTVDAEYNWWGDNTGPSGAGSGSGDAVSENVDYQPWLFRLSPPDEVVPEFAMKLGPYDLQDDSSVNLPGGSLTIRALILNPDLHGTTDIWLDLVDPGGQIVTLKKSISFSLARERIVRRGLALHVPRNVRAGDYRIVLRAGDYGEEIVSQDEYSFVVMPDTGVRNAKEQKVGIVKPVRVDETDREDDMDRGNWLVEGWFGEETLENGGGSDRFSRYSGSRDQSRSTSVRLPDEAFKDEAMARQETPGSTSPLPRAFRLSQNYPNPFNPSTTIRFDIPGEACEGLHVKIQIYNVRGHLMVTLLDERRTCGSYSVQWDGKDSNRESVSSGIYLYRIQAGDYRETRRMLLAK